MENQNTTTVTCRCPTRQALLKVLGALTTDTIYRIDWKNGGGIFVHHPWFLEAQKALAQPCECRQDPVLICGSCGATMMFKREEGGLRTLHSCWPKEARETLEKKNADIEHLCEQLRGDRNEIESLSALQRGTSEEYRKQLQSLECENEELRNYMRNISSMMPDHPSNLLAVKVQHMMDKVKAQATEIESLRAAIKDTQDTADDWQSSLESIEEQLHLENQHAIGSGIQGAIAALQQELSDLQSTFDLRWKADMRAIEMWRKDHPGNDLVMPDHADLVVYLMDELAETREVVTRLDADYEVIRKVLKDLVDQIDLVRDHEAYRHVWEQYFVHSGGYTGPQYADQLNAARMFLEE